MTHQDNTTIDDLEEFNPFRGWTEEQIAKHEAEIEAKRAAAEAQEVRDRAARKRSALASAGFPVRALDAAAVADESTPAIARARDWDPRDQSVLVLSGAPGCGKTVAATWWAARRDRTPMFVRATTFAASSRYDREQRASWFDAGALVLDDLGTEYLDAKGSFLVDLDELLDVFYGDRKPLLITTNCTMPVFRDRYGARIVDRLRECGSFASVGATSLRAKAGA